MSSSMFEKPIICVQVHIINYRLVFIKEGSHKVPRVILMAYCKNSFL